MDYGAPSLCLKAKDLEAARKFYEAIGFAVVRERPGKWIGLSKGNFKITVMNFLERNLLNFRGADVFTVYENVRRAGVPLDGKPESYEAKKYDADADGDMWLTHDPDGNEILFDTNENEIGPSYAADRLKMLLKDTEAELEILGATDCLEAFKREIIAKFT